MCVSLDGLRDQRHHLSLGPPVLDSSVKERQTFLYLPWLFRGSVTSSQPVSSIILVLSPVVLYIRGLMSSIKDLVWKPGTYNGNLQSGDIVPQGFTRHRGRKINCKLELRFI